MKRIAVQMGLAVALLAYGLSAGAEIISADADEESPGTNVSDLGEGVSLSWYEHARFAPELEFVDAIIMEEPCYNEFEPVPDVSECSFHAIGSGETAGTGRNDEYLGLKEFGLGGEDELADLTGFTGLAVESAREIGSLSVSGYSSTGDTVTLFLFDKDGNFVEIIGLGWAVNTGTGPFDGFLLDTTIDLKGQGVHQIHFGSGSAVAWFNKVGVSVPEPGTLALFGAGLIGMGFARRRNKA